MNALLVFATLAGLAPGAPVPKENPTERMKRLFGEWVTPSEDYKITPDERVLRFSMPDTSKITMDDPSSQRGLPQYPRSLKTVSGDFVMTVRVMTNVPNDVQVDKQPETFGVAGGLYFTSKSSNGFVTLRHQPDVQNKWQSTFRHSYLVRVQNGSSGTGSTSPSGRPPQEPAWLRITRTGDNFLFFKSVDGKKWLSIPSGEIPNKALEAELTVGVFAMQRTGKPIEVEFDGFSITQEVEKPAK